MKKVVFLCLFIAGTFAISSCTSNLEQVETINLDRETVFADSAYYSEIPFANLYQRGL